MTSKTRMIAGSVCGALAALFIALYVRGVKADVGKDRAQALERYGGEVVDVCVTTRPVLAGEEFTSENVAAATWLVDLVPEGVLSDPAQLYGKQSAGAKAQNVPLVESDVLGQAVVDVPEGLVACSVPSDDVRAVGGAVTPGKRVDVYVASGGARLVATDVLVLATSAARAGEEVKPQSRVAWVTLALPARLVESVIAATADKSLYLVLPGERAHEVSGQPAPAKGHEHGSHVTPPTFVKSQSGETLVPPADPPKNEGQPVATEGVGDDGNG